LSQLIPEKGTSQKSFPKSPYISNLRYSYQACFFVFAKNTKNSRRFLMVFRVAPGSKDTVTVAVSNRRRGQNLAHQESPRPTQDRVMFPSRLASWPFIPDPMMVLLPIPPTPTDASKNQSKENDAQNATKKAKKKLRGAGSTKFLFKLIYPK